MQQTIVLTEREAIRRKMKYIVEERTRLWTSYEDCLDRLRELDEIDRLATQEKTKILDAIIEEGSSKTITEEVFPVPGVPDFVKQDFKEVPSEVVEVPVHKENQSLQAYFEENKEKLSSVEIKKTKADREKSKDFRDRLVGKGTRRDIKVVAQFVKVILKEAGLPMKASKLIKELKEAGVDMSSNPHSVLHQAVKYDFRIEKPSHGYFQYNTSK